MPRAEHAVGPREGAGPGRCSRGDASGAPVVTEVVLLLVAVALVAACAVFVAAEFSLTTVENGARRTGRRGGRAGGVDGAEGRADG